ncbi:MAG: hypothetical protein CK548_06400 [Opitutia bacterium]|nr:MAG: hypothetical protein CK548_06400 [Opitutae bacterium]
MEFSTLSFRVKLLLAMLLVVAGVAGATLLVTQHQVGTAYDQLFRERLAEQLTYVPKQQEARLDLLLRQSRGFAESADVQRAFSERDTAVLYNLARDRMLRLVTSEFDEFAKELIKESGIPTTPLTNEPATNAPVPVEPKLTPRAAEQKKENSRPPAPKTKAAPKTRPAVRPPAAATFVGFMDETGAVLQPTNGLPAIYQSAARKRFREQLEALSGPLRELEGQQTAYMDLTLENDARGHLLELICLPVFDNETRVRLGTFVLGFPYFDRGERAISEVGDIENGVWLQGRLYTHTIPEAVRAPLARQLEGLLGRDTEPARELLLTLEGRPHRVFYATLNPDSPLPAAYKVGLYSWAEALEVQRQLRWQIIGLALAAAVAAVAASVFLSRGLSRPLRELARGAARIEAGDYAVRIEARTQDEVGQLADAFNQMAEGLALKEKYQHVLGMVTDKTVARRLVSGEIAFGGESRVVSVLFCDIRDFTGLTQTTPPPEVFRMLNEHMTALTQIIHEHHGVVDKFMGDSVMALFGAPESHGNDALNAARCALRMIAERERLNAVGGPRLSIGLGIATGDVVAGCMGSTNRLNYTVLGHRVNLAARLCGAAGDMEALADDVTFAQFSSQLASESVPGLHLKGIAETVTAHRLRSSRAPEPRAVTQ